jgi:hypothetical protein
MDKDFNTTLSKIKNHGYFRINFFPVTSDEISISDVIETKKKIRESVIELRGWDYPHFPTNDKNQGIYIINDHTESWIDWDKFKEIWRYYQSGNFIHLFGLREDWYGEDEWIEPTSIYKKIKPGEVIDVLGITYSFTEIFQFIKNIVEKTDIYNNGITIKISLENVKNRKLTVFDWMRTPLFGDYISIGNTVTAVNKTFTKEMVLKNYLEIAYKAIIDTLHQFNWENIPEEVIREDQKKLLERRI